MTSQEPVTLVELNRKIKSLIKQGLDSYWLTAEISEMSVNYSGHCYLEFIQKEEDSEKIISRARATIWSTSYRMIKPYFETTTGRAFSEGLKVMVRVKVDFHEIYGLSLNVIDIEPTYTVGEAAIRKQKIIEKLHQEGVFDMNRELTFPILPNRLAIISSGTAAGYEDFINQLNTNLYQFRFYYKLFPAVMQGNEAESSIINQLDNIFQSSHHFDAVVLIRGGGAQADLDCFNNYWLAYHICQFPLPVITGIGHEQDDSIADMVAHTRLKTPTAVAEYLIDILLTLDENIDRIQNQMLEKCTSIVNENKILLLKNAHKLQNTVAERLNNETKSITKTYIQYVNTVKAKLSKSGNSLIRTAAQLEQKSYMRIQRELNQTEKLRVQLTNNFKTQLKTAKFNLEIAENKINLNNPLVVMQKGYSITTHNGKVVKNSGDLASGDKIETLFYQGKKKSIIE